MAAGFDIVLYLDIAMQIVLISEEDSPPRSLIVPVLNFHPKIQRTDFVLSTQTSDVTQRLAHCYIYIDRSPSQTLIDKLQETKSPLILIADEDYRSQLFIAFDDLMPTSFSAESLEIIAENINSLISLHEMEYQRNLFRQILTDEDKEEWDRLIFERSQDSIPPNVHEPTPEQELAARPYFEESEKELCDGRDNTKETTGATAKNPILSDNEQKALDSWNVRECPKIASSRLNVSQATYYRIAARARKLIEQLESSSLYPQDSQSFGEKELT
jgi:hypothetical protein